jgi:hypothetical protein
MYPFSPIVLRILINSPIPVSVPDSVCISVPILMLSFKHSYPY